MNETHRTNDIIEIDLLEVFQMLLGRWPIILLSTILGAFIALVIAVFFITPQYTASVTLYVNNKANNDSTQSLSSADLNASAQLVDTYAAIITSNKMLNDVKGTSGATESIKELKEQIAVASVNSTEVFTVKVTNPDPKIAARIANAIADLAPQNIQTIVEGSSVQTVDNADIPESISSPNYKKWTAIGGLLGLIISAGIIIIVGLQDTRIKTEDDFEFWEYPLLSTIPDLEEAYKAKEYGYGERKGGK